MSILDRYKAEYSSLPGWFGLYSAVLWDCLLSYQRSLRIDGNLLEIGLFQGRSAALSTLHAQPGETCVFVDIHIPTEVRAAIDGIRSADVVYVEMPSTRIVQTALISKHARTFRWIHIDGEHTGPAVINDLEISDALLNERGIVSIDDFFSPLYPQITLAVFRWLDSHPFRLHFFLCGLNKAYLCRTLFAREHLKYVKERLCFDLKERGFDDFTICKTTSPCDMNCFGIFQRFQNRDYCGPDWDQGKIEI